VNIGDTVSVISEVGLGIGEGKKPEDFLFDPDAKKEKNESMGESEDDSDDDIDDDDDDDIDNQEWSSDDSEDVPEVN
jgi:hypothetical protein